MSATAHPLAGRRIALLLGSGELGGAERQALHLAGHLARARAARVTCVGMGAPGAAADECAALGIPWVRVPRVESSWLALTIAKMTAVGAILRSIRPELLLPYTAAPNVTAALVRRASGARAAIWNQRDEGLDRLDPRLERLAVRGTSIFVANSPGGARHLERDLGVDPRRIEVIGNGVALLPPRTGRRAWRERLGAADDEVVVGMVANLNRNKDHATLLRAWRIVLDRLGGAGIAARLAIAGRWDDAHRDLVRQAEALGLVSSVIFAGPIDDVAGFLAAVDLAAFCSLTEGSPNALIETMAAGLAVAATDIPAVRAILPEPSLACLAAAGDAEKLADRLGVLIREPGTRARLGAANRERARARHTLPAMLARMEAALVAALAERQGSVPFP